ncbi:hypothetical protein MP213Fo_00960 [Pseudochrobactrum sp. MP213Fo]
MSDFFGYQVRKCNSSSPVFRYRAVSKGLMSTELSAALSL